MNKQLKNLKINELTLRIDLIYNKIAQNSSEQSHDVHKIVSLKEESRKYIDERKTYYGRSKQGIDSQDSNI